MYLYDKQHDIFTQQLLIKYISSADNDEGVSSFSLNKCIINKLKYTSTHLIYVQIDLNFSYNLLSNSL